ncbi:hypothetical protein MMC28_005709 [Mycoblastus sanguinarius]|nr:hypothetical protein [Mycoblastus sanguinarius]
MSNSDASTAPSPIHLDGTTLEGGGQLLRLALSLSSLTHIPIHVTNIRGKRGSPKSPGQGGGLKPAHLAGVVWLAKATAARTVGMEVKSKDLVFEPSSRHGGSETGEGRYGSENDPDPGKGGSEHEGVWKDIYEDGKLVRRDSRIPMSTPGSILLVLQAILPYLLFSAASTSNDQHGPVPLRITIEGGTNVSNSPSIEYVSQVLLPLLSRKLGIPTITTETHKRGWSTGRNDVGSVTFDVKPMKPGSMIPAFSFTDRGELTKVHVSILASDAKIRNNIRDHVIAHLLAYEPEIEIMFPVDDNSGNDKRLYLLLVAETSSGYLLGRDWLFDGKARGSSIEEKCEKLASKVVKDLKRELKHGGCVDEYMQDQLVVSQALAAGRGNLDYGKDTVATLHTRTARWVVQEVLGIGFDAKGRCEGLGFFVGENFRERRERQGVE